MKGKARSTAGDAPTFLPGQSDRTRSTTDRTKTSPSGSIPFGAAPGGLVIKWGVLKQPRCRFCFLHMTPIPVSRHAQVTTFGLWTETLALLFRNFPTHPWHGCCSIAPAARCLHGRQMRQNRSAGRISLDGVASVDGSLQPASRTATAGWEEFPLTDVIPREANYSQPAPLRMRFTPRVQSPRQMPWHLR